VCETKKIGLILAAMLFLAAAPSLFAQEHAQGGVYAAYLNLRHAQQGLWGLGGRVLK
jgi:hypothetical protein